MKKIYLIISIIAAAGYLSSCSDDQDPVYNVTAGNEKSGQMITPEPEKAYVLDEENKYEAIDTFRWSRSEYALPVGIRYTLEIDKEDGNFESPATLTSVSETEIGLTSDDVNKAADVLGLTPKQQAKIKLRLKSNAYGGEEGNILLTQFPTLYSDIIELYITPYEEVRALPLNMYMIGAEFGNWNWESDGIVEMIPVHSKEGEFWCINYFTAGNGFKWAPKRAWANDFNALSTNTGFTVNGGNAEVTSDGVYMVYINMKRSEISIEPAQVYGIGDCFGGWTAAPVPFSISGRLISATTLGAGSLRMYAVSSISDSDWWTREFVVINGQIAYRANGGELESVTVAAGKTVTLDFRAGTGTIN